MCKTIKQKVKFRADPLTIYALLTSQKGHRAFTGKAASINPVVGESFSSYAGDITGINVDFHPGKRVVQAWRKRNFPKGIFSMVTFDLVGVRNGTTELTLTHRGVPKDLIAEVEQEWRERYWDKIKRFLQATDGNDMT